MNPLCFAIFPLDSYLFNFFYYLISIIQGVPTFTISTSLVLSNVSMLSAARGKVRNLMDTLCNQWYLYQMVNQNMLLKHEVKIGIFGEKVTSLASINCLKQIK